MKIAVIQPYFLPYVGYFQLMAAVDKFIILDDVNFIKGGWINRNRILVNREPKWLTVPLVKPSSNRFIRDTLVRPGTQWRDDLRKQCEAAYRDAPYCGDGMRALDEVLKLRGSDVSSFVGATLVYLCDLLGISVTVVPTSTVFPKNGKSGAERILDICTAQHATTYVNSPGGRDLYRAEMFAQRGVQLRFLRPSIHEYPQGGGGFTPGLSVLDLLMWNPKGVVSQMVHEVQLES